MAKVTGSEWRRRQKVIVPVREVVAGLGNAAEASARIRNRSEFLRGLETVSRGAGTALPVTKVIISKNRIFVKARR